MREQESVQTRLQARVQARWVQMQMGADADGCRGRWVQADGCRCDGAAEGTGKGAAGRAHPMMRHTGVCRLLHLACSPPQTIKRSVPTGMLPDFSRPGGKRPLTLAHSLINEQDEPKLTSEPKPRFILVS